MSPDPFVHALDQLREYRQRLIERLERQPREFAQALAAMPAAAWQTVSVPDRQPGGGRSIHQLVCHVRDQEQLAFLPRVRRILAEDRPVLDSFPSHRWNEGAYRPDEPMAQVLAGWSQTRAELVHLLRSMPEAGWTRRGFHPPSGMRTLQWWVERIYTHAREHLVSIQGAPGAP